jgi:hypothetical protein
LAFSFQLHSHCSSLVSSSSTRTLTHSSCPQSIDSDSATFNPDSEVTAHTPALWLAWQHPWHDTPSFRCGGRQYFNGLAPYSVDLCLWLQETNSIPRELERALNTSIFHFPASVATTRLDNFTKPSSLDMPVADQRCSTPAGSNIRVPCLQTRISSRARRG